ncbi:outer membrane lipoprotein-sorting protein, partial [Terracidiphilus sp.]|uniref:outer membrane lipoprotein-sorting protein n=1 Tax=Terracidiphilus sp. TaxID=1964191 RepID=UPI003C1F6E1E
EPTSVPFEKWGESVVGSDFNYEDFLQPEYYWQDQTILKSARFGARDCDVLRSTPGASDHSHYAEVQTWLDHTIDYPVYVEKTPNNGGNVKEFTYFGLSKSGGVWSARQVEVKTHGRPGSTVLIIERGSTKANLGIRDFNPEQISRFEDHP